MEEVLKSCGSCFCCCCRHPGKMPRRACCCCGNKQALRLRSKSRGFKHKKRSASKVYGLQKFPVLAMVLDFSSLYQASGGGCLRVCSTCSSPGLTWTSVVRLNCISWGPSILKPTHLPCTPREVLDPKANATSIPQAAPFPHRGEEAARARPGGYSMGGPWVKTYVAFLAFLSRGFIDPLNFKNHEVVLVPPNIRYGMFRILPFFKMHLKCDFKLF